MNGQLADIRSVRQSNSIFFSPTNKKAESLLLTTRDFRNHTVFPGVHEIKKPQSWGEPSLPIYTEFLDEATFSLM